MQTTPGISRGRSDYVLVVFNQPLKFSIHWRALTKA